MPKPQGTYLQTQKINRIALRARRSKAQYRQAEADNQRLFFERLDLAAARNVAYRAHDYGAEPSDKASVIRRNLAEVVDQLDAYREQLDQLAELHSELREPVFEYRAVTSGRPITVGTVLDVAMVVITLAVALQKVIAGRRR